MRTTIEMAREAAGDDWGLFQEYMPEIHRLAELVRADERARMAEQPAQQEPVGEVNRYGLDSHGRKWHGIYWYDPNVDVPHGTKLYTSPPAQRTWVGSLKSLKLSMQHSAWEGVIQLSDALKNIDDFAAEQPAQQCKWPTCQSEEYQQALAEQIKRELVGEMKPNYNITFHRDGKQIGVLDFNGPEMVFTGDADESAKVFFDFIARAFKGRLDQERADERNSWPAEMEAMERQNNILTDALAQASKDAERYQVLRTWDLGGYDHGLYSPEEVDKAVDDCIKGGTHEDRQKRIHD